jgi:hypothetical protein
MTGEQTDLTNIALGGMGGAALVFVANRFLDFWRERKKIIEHGKALRAELTYIGDLAGTYAQSGYAAPTYRIPSTIYPIVFPTLVTDGCISAKDIMAIIDFYQQVDTSNRSMDHIAELGGREINPGEVERFEINERIKSRAGLNYDKAKGIAEVRDESERDYLGKPITLPAL